MPIQVWLARMERSLTEQEYGDMMALLPDARRERLEKLPKEKHQEVLCAYLLLRMALWEQRGWRDLPRIEVDELRYCSTVRGVRKRSQISLRQHLAMSGPRIWARLDSC